MQLEEISLISTGRPHIRYCTLLAIYSKFIPNGGATLCVATIFVFLYVPIHACSGPMSPSIFATQNFISYTEVSNNILYVHAATP